MDTEEITQHKDPDHEETLPCPFYGNEVEVIDPWLHHGVGYCGSISCKICGFSIGFHHPFIKNVWNKRVVTEIVDIVKDTTKCFRENDCSFIRVEGKCLGSECGVFDPVK